MTKITLSDVSNILGNPTSAANTINANNDVIVAALDLLVSRDGETPNQMTADIDLNNNDLLNVAQAHVDVLFINGLEVTPDDLATIPDTVMRKSVYDPSSIGQEVYDPKYRKDSPGYYGATGDGTTIDTVDYQQAEAVNSVIYLSDGEVYNLSSTDPSDGVFGPGSLKLNGVTIGGLTPKAYPHRSSMYYTPSLVGDDDWLYDDFPVGGGHGNTIFGAGSAENAIPENGAATIVGRVTSFGSLNLVSPVSIDRCDIFGQGAMRWMRYGERNTALGTLSQQWNGSDLTLDTGGKYYHHDLIYNAGTLVTNPAWDAFSLETSNPGIRATIAAWLATNPWATATTDSAYNVSIGRDSLVELVKGTSNTAVGYRAAGLTLDAVDNTAVGDNAMFNNVFGDQNTAVGKNSGFNHQDGNANTFLGRNAGFGNLTGNNNVLIGNNSGNGGSILWAGDRNVVIGNSSGTKTDSSTPAAFSDRLFIQNLAGRAPLLNGDFAAFRLGINLPVEDSPIATLDVFNSSPGTLGYSFDSSFVAAVFRHSGAGSLQMLTPNTQIGGLYFGDTDAQQQGGITYNHSTDQMRIRVTNGNRFILDQNFLNIAAQTAASAALQMNGTQVLGIRKTGWTTDPTGTLTRTTFATSTVTLPQLAERVAALIVDLRAHGLIQA